MRAVAVILTLVSSALAYQVLIPSASQGWTNQGGQPLSWQRVETDKRNFTVVLDNQNITSFSPQILAALVDGTLGKTSLNPPSGGWPTGSHFRLNFVQDPNNLNTIYAQSSEFTISPSSSTLTTSTIATATSTDASTDGTTPTDSAQLVPTGTKSGALAAYSVNSGAFVLFSFLVYLLT
jgi:hypothetical protein